jgi:mannosyl-3-phosphoglycerate phosphatase
LERVRAAGAPLVLVSSKTRAEMEFWRGQFANSHPFIVENGGAAFIPRGYFGALESAVDRGDYQVLEWGTNYASLCRALRAVEIECGCRLTGFHQLTAAQIAGATGLTLEQAEMARRREYDEPFLADEGCDAACLRAAVESLGLRHTWGGRLPHLHGNNDKAVAVRALRGLYEKNGAVSTIGLGDAPNDLPFLREADHPVIIRSPDSDTLRRELPWARVTRRAGPEGWNEAVLELLDADQS